MLAKRKHFFEVFHRDGERPFGAWLSNISCGGALLEAEHSLPEGTEVRLAFGERGGYDVEAEVVRLVDPADERRTTLGIAVRFLRELPAS